MENVIWKEETEMCKKNKLRQPFYKIMYNLVGEIITKNDVWLAMIFSPIIYLVSWYIG